MQQTHWIARNNLIHKKEDNIICHYGKNINPLTLHVGDKVLIKEQHLNWLKLVRVI